MIWTYIKEIVGLFVALILITVVWRWLLESNATVSNGQMHRMNWVYRFFCWCGGTDLNTLRRYPSEYNRHFGIGTMVTMTGLFAFISSSYALSTIFKDMDGAIDFKSVYAAGTVWAFFIFFLDRYFVSSMRNRDRFWDEFKMASPRLVLAILIGIVISHPLELRMFQSEIQYELVQTRNFTLEKEDSLYKKRIETEKEGLNVAAKRSYSTEGIEIARLDSLIQKERTEREVRVKPVRDSVQCECNGGCGSLKFGRGPACIALEGDLRRLLKESQDQIAKWEAEKQPVLKVIKENQQKEIELRDKEIANIQIRIRELDSLRIARKTELQRVFSTSLLAQSQTLTSMSHRPGVLGMWLLVTFLFIMLEIAPILVKLMSSAGAYEEAMITEEQRNYADTQQQRHLIREERRLNQDLIRRTAAAQREIMRQAVERWRVQQMEEPDDVADAPATEP
jgi:Domain of unknown function (DUF4407)